MQSHMFVVILAVIAWRADAARSMLYLGRAGHKLRGNTDYSSLASNMQTSIIRTPETTRFTQELAQFAVFAERLRAQESASSVSISGDALEEQPLLPTPLRPEVAYFDVTRGVSTFDDETQAVISWADVLMDPDAPTNAMWFEGDCRLVTPGSSAPASVWFDGSACSGRTGDSLSPLWDNSSSGNFTAIWIGRVFDGTELIFPEHTSRTPFGFLSGLYATTLDVVAAVDNDEDGDKASLDEVLLPPPPLHRWTMEVASRSSGGPGEVEGSLAVLYHRYGSGGSGSWHYTTVPFDVFLNNELVVGSDMSNGLGFFYGELSVVLLYNRALAESEVRQLATFYAPRFGWEAPQ